ncbi:MAG: hypothetical protein IPH80_09620 [Myxococcales bacterium]|jgi:DNA-directed RNA polymerase specialized sigma24 family protein|nr:hypothetical protein [Myxococcales bacterium]
MNERNLIMRESEKDLRTQLERTVRRIKRAMLAGKRSGSKTTNDFVQILLTRLVRSGRYAHEVALRRDQRSFVISVKNALLDELDHLKATGLQDLDGIEMLPNDEDIEAAISDFEDSQWVDEQIQRLRAGQVDPRAQGMLVDARMSGEVLFMTRSGASTAEIAKQLACSVGSVVNRRQEGIGYLAKLWRATESSL